MAQLHVAQLTPRGWARPLRRRALRPAS